MREDGQGQENRTYARTLWLPKAAPSERIGGLKSREEEGEVEGGEREGGYEEGELNGWKRSFN